MLVYWAAYLESRGAVSFRTHDLGAGLASHHVDGARQPGDQAAVANVAGDEEAPPLVLLGVARLAHHRQALGELAAVAHDVAQHLGLEADHREVALVVFALGGGIVGRVAVGEEPQAAAAVQAQVAADLPVTVEGAARGLQHVVDGGEGRARGGVEAVAQAAGGRLRGLANLAGAGGQHEQEGERGAGHRQRWTGPGVGRPRRRGRRRGRRLFHV